MDKVLIVSGSEKGTGLLTALVNEAGIHQITSLTSALEVRRLLLERSFDLIIINAPLKDESGEDLSRQVAFNAVSQVILIVKSEHYEAITAICEDYGVLTIAKPINKAVFWSALKLAGATMNRLRLVHNENQNLKQKIEDIRIIDRAKCLLISYMGLSEKEAHRYIEKQAMDMRQSKRAIAEGILKTYEN